MDSWTPRSIRTVAVDAGIGATGVGVRVFESLKVLSARSYPGRDRGSGSALGAGESGHHGGRRLVAIVHGHWVSSRAGRGTSRPALTMCWNLGVRVVPSADRGTDLPGPYRRGQHVARSVDRTGVRLCCGVAVADQRQASSIASRLKPLTAQRGPVTGTGEVDEEFPVPTLLSPCSSLRSGHDGAPTVR